MTRERTTLRERALAVRAELDAALGPTPVWLRDVAPMADAFEALPPAEDFTFVSAEIEALDARLGLVDAPLDDSYRLVLVELVRRALAGPHELVLPRSVEAELLGDHRRILEEAVARRPWGDPIGDGDFMLDACLARGTVLPFGITVGTFCGGVLRTHLRASELDRFRVENIQAAALAQADLLALNPQLTELRTASWLLDPALEEVSPHLCWLREWLVDGGGASLEPTGTPDHVVENALATSRTRRRLYEEGRYAPQAYEVVWLREEMVRWAARCRGRDQGGLPPAPPPGPPPGAPAAGN
jgi:hypothetical protein